MYALAALKHFRLIALFCVAVMVGAACCSWYVKPQGPAGPGVYIGGEWDYPSPSTDAGAERSDQHFRLR